MKRKLTRRRFARLAIVGTVAAGSIAATGIPFASTILARSEILSVLGVRAGPVPTDDSETPSTSAAVPLVLQSIDLTTGQQQTVSVAQVVNDGSPLLQVNEVLTGCALLADGTVLIAITPVSGNSRETQPTRVTTTGARTASVSISALRADEALTNMIVQADGSLLGVVSRRNGNSPAKLVDVDPGSGSIGRVQPINVPSGWRLNTLAQAPDGQLLGTVVDRQGQTNLVQVGARGAQITLLAPLTTDGIAWNNGLQNLVFTPGGQLVGFGALRGVTPNALYGVDARTGAMRKLHAFDVVRVTAPRA